MFYKPVGSIPVNATAEVHLPTANPAAVLENGVAASASDGVAFLKTDKQKTVYAIQSGRYMFSVPLQDIK